MARGKGQGRGGLIAAYLLVLTLIGASAAFVFGVAGETPRITEPAAAAAASEAPLAVASLAVPPKPVPARPIPAAQFRGFAGAELADMVEVTDEGQRLPRVSPSGWMPWIALARRFDPAGPPARVGVLMINLGASEALMKRAIDELPGEVSTARARPRATTCGPWTIRMAWRNAASGHSRHRPSRPRMCVGCARRWPAARVMSAS